MALQYPRLPATGSDAGRSPLAVAESSARQQCSSAPPRSFFLFNDLEVFQYGVSQLLERRHHPGILCIATGRKEQNSLCGGGRGQRQGRIVLRSYQYFVRPFGGTFTSVADLPAGIARLAVVRIAASHGKLGRSGGGHRSVAASLPISPGVPAAAAARLSAQNQHEI